MIMKKKKHRNPIHELPYDCWCHIIEYFEDKIDFLNLLFCVKGVYEYIKHISPQCTRNIAFSLSKNFPKSVQPHVTHLKYIMKGEEEESYDYWKNESMEESLRGMSFVSFESFFKTVLEQFSNLWKLNIRGCKWGSYYRDIPKKFRTINLVGEIKYNTLVHLHLRFPPVSYLLFDYHLPKLKTLYLNKTIRPSKRMEDNLEINFSKLPMLKDLDLDGGWVLEINEKAKPKLRKLCLRICNVLGVSNDFENFKNLTSLHDYSSIFTSPKGIEKSKLESLSLHMKEPLVFLNWKDAFQNLRFLKKLSLRGSLYKKLDGTMKISFLPHLEELVFSFLRFKIEILNIPKLRKLEIDSCDSPILLPHPSMNTPNIEVFMVREMEKWNIPMLKSNDFSSMKNSLRTLEINETSGSPWNNPFGGTVILSINDFKNLENLELNYVRLKTLKNCPNLKRVDIMKVCNSFLDFIEIKSLPKLEELKFSVRKLEEFEEVLRKIKMPASVSIKFANSVDCQIVTRDDFKLTLDLSTYNTRNIKNLNLINLCSFSIIGDASSDLESLYWGAQQEDEYMCVSYISIIEISNLSKLKKCTADYVNKLVVKDCELLEELNAIFCGEHILLHLENLKSLKDLKSGFYMERVESFVVRIGNVNFGKVKCVGDIFNSEKKVSKFLEFEIIE